MKDSLFENTEAWREHWKGMPEYESEKVDTEFHKITIRFRNKEDLEAFADLIGQKVTPKTKSIYHPPKPHRRQDPKEWH